MRNLPAMEAIWRSGDFVSDLRRPMVRVTVQRPKMALRHYSVMSTSRKIDGALSGVGSVGTVMPSIDPNHGTKVSQTYADFFFTPVTAPKELLNVKSVSWQRSLTQDFATMTLELYNTIPRSETDPIPSPFPVKRRDLDHPGWYTFDRGKSTYAGRWGNVRNEWLGMLMPDNLIRTYEGYGINRSRPPESDRQLVESGVWIIDSVVLNALGLIVVNCRDVGRLLLDHQVSPPVIPKDFDQLAFANWDTKVLAPPSRVRLPITVRDHSNRYGPFIGGDGELHDALPDPDDYRGHHPQDTLDDTASTYWMSFAHVRPRWPWGVEWIEYALPNASIGSVQMWLVGHGYTCYVSVYSDGAWRGEHSIRWSPNPQSPPYPDYRDQDAHIPYVTSHVTGKEFATGLSTIMLPKVYDKVTRVRLSFVNLQHLPGVSPRTHSFRVGVRNVRVRGPLEAHEVGLRIGPAGSNPGRYRDYSDIVKLCCAWAGFFWPPTGFNIAADGSSWKPYYTHADWDLGVNGRIWGDFEPVGTTGPAAFTPDNLENKSLMDVISMVRDITGFIFLIDEVGSTQWRMPNIYRPGNWLNNDHMNANRSHRMTIIDEKQVLLSLDSTLNSGNLKEIIRVTNFIETATARGFIPNDVGLRRVLSWNEPRFENKVEMQRGADMTAVRSLFTWRTDRIMIPGFPGIQIDDQVQIFERISGEGYIHYVNGISSSLDLESGEWTYTLETHWLGDKTGEKWAINPADLPDSVTAKLGDRWVRPAFRKRAD